MKPVPSVTILNVDDTATSRAITTLVLRKSGFNVVEAATGHEALLLVEAMPQLVLLDVNLPDLDGLEVCRRIKTNPRTATIPVVHLSAARISSEDRVAGLEEGADGYLTHPVDPRELIATIGAFLRLKRAEHALRESERWHRALFEHAHDALITLAPPHWQFTSGNSAALAMFGVRDAIEFPPASLWDYSPEYQPDGCSSRVRASERIQFALREGLQVFDWVCKRPSGETFPANVLLTRIDGDGEPLLLATLRDETEKRRLEASVAQADRLASMGILAASMAHELNNPLAYVHYNIESLAEDLPVLTAAVERCCGALRAQVGEAAFLEIAEPGARMLEPPMLLDAFERVRDALEGTRRMKDMTRGLGMFSRVEQAQRSRCNIHVAIESAISLASNEITQRAQLIRNFGDTPSVWGSEGKLSQVFLNLLVNAAHAIDEGEPQNNQITVHTWSDQDWACIEISDTGRGISTENISSIFEPFFTTKPIGMGTGLGLSICKKIVTELGGDLTVESRAGNGSRFVVRLPGEREFRPIEANDETPRVLPRGAKSLRGRVLIVDDEEAIRRSMGRLLGRDHDVVVVTTGEQAQTLLEEDPAFDVVVCDLMMSGMSGMSLHEWLANRDPWLAKQVVFVTGGAFTPRARDYLAQVGNVTLEKPCDSRDLQRLVADMVRRAKLQ